MRRYTEEKSNNRIEDYTEYVIRFKGTNKKLESVLLVIERCPDGCMPLWVKNKIFKEQSPSQFCM